MALSTPQTLFDQNKGYRGKQRCFLWFSTNFGPIYEIIFLLCFRKKTLTLPQICFKKGANVPEVFFDQYKRYRRNSYNQATRNNINFICEVDNKNEKLPITYTKLIVYVRSTLNKTSSKTVVFFFSANPTETAR